MYVCKCVAIASTHSKLLQVQNVTHLVLIYSINKDHKTAYIALLKPYTTVIIGK